MSRLWRETVMSRVGADPDFAVALVMELGEELDRVSDWLRFWIGKTQADEILASDDKAPEATE